MQLFSRGWLQRVLILSSALALGACGDQYPQTTFAPVSEFGRVLNQLFANTFWWTIGILVLVELLIVYCVFRFRAREGAPMPKQIHGNVKLEFLWTVIPAVIVLFIAIPTIQVTFATQRRAPADALTVEVIGHQWWWEFRYPEYGVVTANELVLPAGRDINLKMHSADVIHSFWIPRVGGKRDVNPLPRPAEGEGPPRSNYLVFNVEESGYFAGQCAEFCGAAHAIMRSAVVAMQPDEFTSWVSSMGGASAAAALPDVSEAQVPPALPAATPLQGPATPAVQPTAEQQGRELFEGRACIACHAVAGTNAQGVLGPSLTRFGSRRYLGAGARPNTQENLEAWITNPRALKPGTLMPGTQEGAAGMPPTGLTAEEVRAIAAYLLSLK